MSMPVKLSDTLVLEARLAAEVQERSIAGQVEYWAKLGQAVEELLNGAQQRSLRRNGDSLSEALARVDTPEGRRRVEEVVASRPYPHFRQAEERPGLLVRIDADGTETLGRFLRREFVALSESEGNAVAEPVACC
jgi:hypothetical protein